MSQFLTDIEQQEIAGSEALEPQYNLLQVPCYIEDRLIDLNNITIDDIDWKIIARVLSRIPRFNGQTGQGCAFSYAQHSVIGADVLAKETNDSIKAGYFLLKDTHKVFMGEISRPMQMLLLRYPTGNFHKSWREIKNKIMANIYKKAALPAPEQPITIINTVGFRLLQAECLTFFKHAKQQFGDIAQYKIPPIKPWGAVLAEEQYCDRLHRYLGIRL